MMSILNSTSLGGFIPGAVSQALRGASVDRLAADAAQIRFQLDRATQSEKAVGDLGSSGKADDRDADGRTPWSDGGGSQDRTTQDESDSPGPLKRVKSIDPDANLGQRLDFDA